MTLTSWTWISPSLSIKPVVGNGSRGRFTNEVVIVVMAAALVSDVLCNTDYRSLIHCQSSSGRVPCA
jgi:hypothetical protein